MPFGDRYGLTQLLAVGGMAEIYLGFQNLALGMSKPVVIKRLKPALVGDVRATQMFEDEARLMALLSHGHVVHCHDVGEDGGVPFIVMEYIRGQELNQLARRGLQVGHFLPRALAVELIRQAALGLGYCHALLDDAGGALELVHCDLSPNNLLVIEDGAVKVIDFGIAQFAGQSLRGSRAVPGKLSYMSPEQAR
ncbi:MAG: serine/threonine protein kinase, partial [Deltaproteobacteria bacterium]|nr:serine/threonine protein kinase [Deltaproteobacteria bacterium]